MIEPTNILVTFDRGAEMAVFIQGQLLLLLLLLSTLKSVTDFRKIISGNEFQPLGAGIFF